jgi:hypothetical protein
VNPGLLKFQLAHDGAVLDPSLYDRPDILGTTVATRDDEAPTAPPATLAVDLVLPGDLLVRVPLVRGAGQNAAFILCADGNRLFVVDGGSSASTGRHEVRATPQPRFYSRTTRHGMPMRDVAAVFGSYIAVHPAAACGFSIRGLPCGPCAGQTDPPQGNGWSPQVEDVVEVVRAAFDEGAAEFVYFNTPFSAMEDGGAIRTSNQAPFQYARRGSTPPTARRQMD